MVNFNQTVVLSSSILIWSYFSFDLPNALSDKIKEKITHEVDSDNQIKYNQLYSVYSYPNMVLPLIGGILTDKFGIHFSMILFSTLVWAGQVVFTISGYMADNRSDDWPFIVSLIGRFIYGLGGESLLVCQTVIISKWFINKELSLALGSIQSWMMIGVTLWGFIIPPLSNVTSLGFAINFSCFISALSLLFIIAIIYVDKKSNNKYTADSDTEKFKLKDIKEFNFIYWIVIICYFFSSSWMMFYGVLNDFFTTRYGFSQVESAIINGSITLVCSIFAILSGFLYDKFGYRATAWVLLTLLLTLSNIFFILIPSSTPENIND